MAMATKNPRINITFEESTAGLLSYLANQEHKSVSGLAKELIIDALDRREDMFLAEIAERRDHADSRKVKHTDVWK